jgi:hypothetical protein
MYHSLYTWHRIYGLSHRRSGAYNGLKLGMRGNPISV